MMSEGRSKGAHCLLTREYCSLYCRLDVIGPLRPICESKPPEKNFQLCLIIYLPDTCTINILRGITPPPKKKIEENFRHFSPTLTTEIELPLSVGLLELLTVYQWFCLAGPIHRSQPT